MNIDRAIKIITNKMQADEKGYTADIDEALAIAQRLMLKGMPQQPKMLSDGNDFHVSCPYCLKSIVNVWNSSEYKPKYCHYCGQALDWSEDNNKVKITPIEHKSLCR